MRLHVGCRAGQLGIATHDLFVLVRSRAPDVLPGAPTASTLSAGPTIRRPSETLTADGPQAGAPSNRRRNPTDRAVA